MDTVKVSLVIKHHMNKVNMEVSRENADLDHVNHLIEFITFLETKFTDKNTRIDPDSEWDKFQTSKILKVI